MTVNDISESGNGPKMDFTFGTILILLGMSIIVLLSYLCIDHAITDSVDTTRAEDENNPSPPASGTFTQPASRTFTPGASGTFTPGASEIFALSPPSYMQCTRIQNDDKVPSYGDFMANSRDFAKANPDTFTAVHIGD